MAGDTQTNVVITDNAAKWLVIVILALLGAYGVANSQRADDTAKQAEMDARLAQYYAVDLKITMAQAGLKPPTEPWASKKGPKQ